MRLLLLTVWAVMAAGFLVVLALLFRSSGTPPPWLATRLASTGPTLEKLETLQELVVQKVTVSDILTYTDGSLSAAWLIRGDGLISVSLKDAQIIARVESSRTATIRLPPPTVLSARIDHERTAFWEAKQGLWNRINPWGTTLQDVEGRAMREAQRLVEQAVQAPEQLQQARRSATILLTRLYGALDWTVVIEWSDQPPVIHVPAGIAGAVPTPK